MSEQLTAERCAFDARKANQRKLLSEIETAVENGEWSCFIDPVAWDGSGKVFREKLETERGFEIVQNGPDSMRRWIRIHWGAAQ